MNAQWWKANGSQLCISLWFLRSCKILCNFARNYRLGWNFSLVSSFFPVFFTANELVVNFLVTLQWQGGMLDNWTGEKTEQFQIKGLIFSPLRMRCLDFCWSRMASIFTPWSTPDGWRGVAEPPTPRLDLIRASIELIVRSLKFPTRTPTFPWSICNSSTSKIKIWRRKNTKQSF